MTTLEFAALQDSYPAMCINEGLNCETCTSQSARHLAATCRGLKGPMVRQLFVQIYPFPACSPMVNHFTESYRRASGVPLKDNVTEIARPAAPLAMATVA